MIVFLLTTLLSIIGVILLNLAYCAIFCKSKWWPSKWNPWGNHEEPDPPEVHRTDLKGWKRRMYWIWRNPLHNFTHHWIGYYGQVAVRGTFFADKGWNWDYSLTKDGDRLYLLSYRGEKKEGYIGFRPSGAFGIAWRTANAKNASER